MRVAYFDCFAGIAGDMILGALLDAGLDAGNWKDELGKLGLPGYEIEISKTERQHISATDVKVKIKESHHHRKLADIEKIISQSRLGQSVKEKSVAIFRRLAWAEGKVHGMKMEEVYFHEVGAVDAIVDIVGGVVGLDLLGIEKIYCSELPLTDGTVKTAHGDFPIPAPATLELLKDFPLRKIEFQGELVTPTGAAILATLGSYHKNLEIIPEATGYGAGDNDYKEFPNLLRVIIGRIPGRIPEKAEISGFRSRLPD